MFDYGGAEGLDTNWPLLQIVLFLLISNLFLLIVAFCGLLSWILSPIYKNRKRLQGFNRVPRLKKTKFSKSTSIGP